MTENYPEALATNASPDSSHRHRRARRGFRQPPQRKDAQSRRRCTRKNPAVLGAQRARASGIAERIVVTVPTDCAHRCPQLLADAAEFDALVTEGGNTRTASVIAALDALAAENPSIERVLTHDCARALHASSGFPHGRPSADCRASGRLSPLFP